MSRSNNGGVEVLSLPELHAALFSSERPLRQFGQRRIFVQTDDGSVLGVDVHRSDNPNRVKKAVQSVLRVPTEQSELLYGGHVLKDFSKIRSDVPVRLQKGLSRSSSSPCLSPVPMSIPLHAEKGIEVVGGYFLKPRLRKIISEALQALNENVLPTAIRGGLGGAYVFKNCRGGSLAIVKPTDEEPFAPNNPNGYVGRSLGDRGMKRNIRVGEAGVREVAAYLLDHKNVAKVPHTALVKVTSSAFNVNDEISSGRSHVPTKLASLQEFVQSDYDASEHGTAAFPAASVHWIGILDIRIFNLDRHSGNILVREIMEEKRGLQSRFELTPIDHGFSLPDSLESPYFEWQHWTQASLPFSQEALDYIESLDPYSDVELLKRELNNILSESCLRILVISTTLLKVGAKAGLTLCEIASMMCAEVRGMSEEPSELERICSSLKSQLKLEIANSISNENSVPDQSWNTFEELEQFAFDEEISGGSDSEFVDTDSIEEGVRESVESALFPPLIPTPLAGLYGKNMHVSLMEGRFLALLGSKGPLIPSSFASSSNHKKSISGYMDSASFSEESSQLSSTAISKNLSSSSDTSGNSRIVRNEEFLSELRFPQVDEIDKAFPADGGIDFGKLSEGNWKLFMSLFEVAVREAMDLKKEAEKSLIKRFGSSCKF